MISPRLLYSVVESARRGSIVVVGVCPPQLWRVLKTLVLFIVPHAVFITNPKSSLN